MEGLVEGMFYYFRGEEVLFCGGVFNNLEFIHPEGEGAKKRMVRLNVHSNNLEVNDRHVTLTDPARIASMPVPRWAGEYFSKLESKYNEALETAV